MADFDPLGIVKAMGPQRDPFSWAELYSQDASKHEALGKELRNKMLIQQMAKEVQQSEGAQDRASREGIAERSQEGQNSRSAMRLKMFLERQKQLDADYDPPPGFIPEKMGEARGLGIGGPKADFDKGYRYVSRANGKVKGWIPIGSVAPPSRSATPAPTDVEDLPPAYR